MLPVGRGGDAREIAVLKIAGNEPGLVWFGGYRSDMAGTKAEAMMKWAACNGFAATRFDYSGHGQSGGDFFDGTISRWVEECCEVLSHHTSGPQILVGSSMGGWISLIVAKMRAAHETGQSAKTGLECNMGFGKIAGMLLIAPAADFTEALMVPALTPDQVQTLETRGFIEQVSQYSDEPDIITRALIEDGRKNYILEGIIQTDCPVVILQGMKDPDVPYTHTLRLLNHLPAERVTLTLINDGDHRLSRDQDIQLMTRSLERLCNLQT